MCILISCSLMLTKFVTLICVLSVASSSTIDGESELSVSDSIALVESQSRKYPRGKRVSFDQLDDHRPRFSEGSNTSEDATEFPRTPYVEYYAKEYEDADPLMKRDNGSFADDLPWMLGGGCSVIEEIKLELIRRRTALVDGVKTNLRASGEAAATYAISKLFGYTLTEEDKAMVSDMVSRPDWIPNLIRSMHAVCNTTRGEDNV